MEEATMVSSSERGHPWPRVVWFAALLLVSAGPGSARAQLRVVTYNTTGGINSNLEIVLRAIGEEDRNGIARPIDILLLQEQNSASGNTQSYVNYLNSLYGTAENPAPYARGSVNGGPFTSSIRQTIVYNTLTLDLVAENAFGNTINTPENPAQERQTLRYQLRPDGYSAADFFIYNSHYRAGSTSGDQMQRTAEATTIRTNASSGSDALGEGAHAIFVGDYNMQSSAEAAFQTLIGAGPGQANDPINRLGLWNNNPNFSDVHTQSPCTSGCGAGGGMDDRFDFQLVTGEFLDSEGLSYIPGSYRAFGNNGTTYNADINNASNSYSFEGVTTYTRTQVLNALRNGTDHLPVVADYQVPAVMQAMISVVPAALAVGEPFSVDVTVRNAANVQDAIGADELEYSLIASGDVAGSFLDEIDLALGGSNLYAIGLDTSTPGMKSGLITIASSSQSVQNGLIEIPISYEVIGTTLPGDFNEDGVVNAADYVVWRKVNGTPGGYEAWRNNFGAELTASGVVAATGPTPEPGAWLLATLGGCLSSLVLGRLNSCRRAPLISTLTASVAAGFPRSSSDRARRLSSCARSSGN
jgi:endonuclease/exonuclease/phosphatase family metal-dependent hydrolase